MRCELRLSRPRKTKLGVQGPLAKQRKKKTTKNVHVVAAVAAGDASTSPHRFEFDLDRGIREQLVEKLESSPKLPLEKSVGPQESGIYALYRKDRLLYVGKATKELTKSGRTLRSRLNEHRNKIAGRQNITVEEMSCRYLTFESEWWVFAAEFALVVHYDPEWNGSGFGSKTPGIGRPGTERVSSWNEQFPLKVT